ncbi:MAG: DNA polymerase III subunit delta' [Rhodospirillum sp.]|nr:DNA polymerase III subunit delta' [Rhodospirillum sp.]MCF8487710.1 DNA polymerase III subunit delta' [Rhodospirillum sp.]MCF8502409.1 DNA polymerase III subunit delta' [Rhodospirillum sp.]
MTDLSPRTNPDLLGHGDVEREILETQASGRVGHAWLISGPRGVGKATLAYRFARHILAGRLDPPEGEGAMGCGLFGAEAAPVRIAPDAGLGMDPEHPVFRRVVAGSHGDLRVIERAVADEKTGRRKTEIVVGDVRDLAHFMGMTPSEGGWRVVIVDEAETMNRNAANALLKVLEEPPGRAMLLLVSHNPARLLPTIRSRCRRLQLGALGDDILEHLIARHLPELGPEDRRSLVALAEGSIGRAIDLAGQGGLDLCREVISMLGALPRLDVTRLHALGDKVARDDQAFSALAELFPWWLARMTRSGALGQAPAQVISGEAEVAARLLGAAPLDRWIEVWEKVGSLFERARAVHLDRKQTVLSAFLAVEQTLGRS